LPRIKKKTSKNPNSFISKVVIPKEDQSVDHISIPKRAIKYIAGGVCLLMVFIIGAFVHYNQVVSNANDEKAELESLRSNNQSQMAEIDELSKKTIQLQNNMDRLNALGAEIRNIVNNDSPIATSRSGLVRPSVSAYSEDSEQEQLELDDINNRVNQLQVAVKVREASLNSLKEELLSKQARIAATPSIWPVNGQVTSPFGRRGMVGEFHPGIDIAAAMGNPVVATADGIVVYSQWDDGGYGKLVEIDHGNGIHTLYGHNSGIVVTNGQEVKKGQLIAYSGSTGYSTGPHVHYEIRVNGTAVDPRKFLN
jgi:murein DD-endopeptidase MepM/ murein hydrolase activator NlpD